MKLRFAIVVLAVLVPCWSYAQPGNIQANAPITNFKLPVFNDEGNRTSLLRGTEGRIIDEHHIDLYGMQYTLFEEDGSNRVNTTLVAPSASFFPNGKRYKVQGSEGVRIVRDDLDVAGTNWVYEQDEKKNRQMALEGNVRVVFRTLNLGNILK
ncbi:MAG: hypothetical protein QM790_10225 [Nibricoccus sp.]